MSIIFKKTRDKDNHFDVSEVTMEVDSVSLPDILEEFKGFLVAAGFSLCHTDRIEIVKEGDYDVEKED